METKDRNAKDSWEYNNIIHVRVNKKNFEKFHLNLFIVERFHNES